MLTYYRHKDWDAFESFDTLALSASLRACFSLLLLSLAWLVAFRRENTGLSFSQRKSFRDAMSRRRPGRPQDWRQRPPKRKWPHLFPAERQISRFIRRHFEYIESQGIGSRPLVSQTHLHWGLYTNFLPPAERLSCAPRQCRHALRAIWSRW